MPKAHAAIAPPELLRTLDAVKEAIQNCQRCDLFRNATRAVGGEGPRASTIVLIGEQPGNDEDLAGRPFARPAGRLLDRALTQAGIDRESVYVTNAVKHFKFEERGKRRIHKKPSASEVTACRPWLEMEISIIRPRIIVALGATGGEYCLRTRLPVDEGAWTVH
jgi:DNA polymerase